ncbi:MAG: sporulation integral membrane protein YtvI [Lachnospiraceae bacterium]|nr:sporulation integral membrane protein YtvI [Lachnospiraceae bacterium]
MEKVRENTKLVLNVLLPLLAMVLVVWLLPKVIIWFLPFFVGWIISLIANPLVKFLEKHLKIVRKAGSAIVIVLVLALVILIIYGVISALASQVQQLMEDMPSVAKGVQSDYHVISQSINDLTKNLPAPVQDRIDVIMENFGTYLGTWTSNIGESGLANRAGDMVSNLPSIVIGVIVGFLAAYFFIAEKHNMDEFCRHHATKGMMEKYHIIRVQLIDVIGGYFKAQFKIMAVVYVILVIGLGLLRTSFFGITSLGIAFVDMLPFFGTGTILGPWAIINLLTGDYKMAICLIILYGVTQLVRQLIQPKLLGDSIGMNPFATLFFMYLGYKIAGVLGMLIAVPIAMIIINLYKAGMFDTMIYAGKTLYKRIRKFLHLEIPNRPKRLTEKQEMKHE